MKNVSNKEIEKDIKYAVELKKKEHKMPKLMGDCEGGSKKQVHKEGRDHTFITQ